MPRKIDWEMRARRQLINKQLNRQNAIINAINSGNITKAEILSGEELVVRDPIQDSLVRKQLEKKVIKDKLDRDDRELAN